MTLAGSCQEETAATPFAEATAVSIDFFRAQAQGHFGLARRRVETDVVAHAEAGRIGQRQGSNGTQKGREGGSEQGDHQRGLEGSNAAARLVNADHSGADLNDVAMLDGWDSEEAKQFDRRRNIQPHQGLDQEVLHSGGPGDGHEEEADRKKKS